MCNRNSGSDVVMKSNSKGLFITFAKPLRESSSLLKNEVPDGSGGDQGVSDEENVRNKCVLQNLDCKLSFYLLD